MNLIYATLDDDITMVKQLIKAGTNLDFQDIDGVTSLMHASSDGNYRIVKLLINAGANLDLQDNSGWTALIWASDDFNAEIVKLLIDAGANINLRNWQRKTAFDIGNNKIKKLIIQKALKDEFNKRKLLTFTAGKKLHKELYMEIGKFLFGRRKYSRH